MHILINFRKMSFTRYAAIRYLHLGDPFGGPVTPSISEGVRGMKFGLGSKPPIRGQLPVRGLSLSACLMQASRANLYAFKFTFKTHCT